MKQRKFMVNGGVLILLVLGSILGIFTFVLGQGMDEEPNNTCETAQAVGAVELPFTLDGSLDTPPAEPDVDFFRFTGVPGEGVQVELNGIPPEQGVGDPVLGLFNSECILIAVNDDSGSLNSRLLFTIPADGVFVLAATGYPDFNFVGEGFYSGTYQLALAPAVFAGSISGRVVDAVTGTPLPGDSQPFAIVELYRCSNGDCFEFVNSQSTDSMGEFRFDSDFNGVPLLAGTYRIIAYAAQYETRQTEPFDVGEGEDVDIGDIALTPHPVVISESRACSNLPSTGGICSYRIRITNRQDTPFQGAAWSNVNASEIGSVLNFTLFPAGPPRRVSLAPQQSKNVHFAFRVPGTVQDGAFICADAFVGQGSNPFFDTVAATFLFCISKGADGEFRVVPEQEARERWQQLYGTLPYGEAPYGKAPAPAKGKE